MPTYKEIFFYSTIQVSEMQWHKAGAVIVLGEGEDPNKEYEALKATVEKWQKIPPTIQKEKEPQQESEEFNIWKINVVKAATKEDAEEIIAASGGWAIPLRYQTKDIVNKKPNKI